LVVTVSVEAGVKAPLLLTEPALVGLIAQVTPEL